MRVELIKLDAEEYVVMVAGHHIIYDGWSMAIFLREVYTSYAALLWVFRLRWPSRRSSTPILPCGSDSDCKVNCTTSCAATGSKSSRICRYWTCPPIVRGRRCARPTGGFAAAKWQNRCTRQFNG